MISSAINNTSATLLFVVITSYAICVRAAVIAGKRAQNGFVQKQGKDSDYYITAYCVIVLVLNAHKEEIKLKEMHLFIVQM